MCVRHRRLRQLSATSMYLIVGKVALRRLNFFSQYGLIPSALSYSYPRDSVEGSVAIICGRSSCRLPGNLSNET